MRNYKKLLFSFLFLFVSLLLFSQENGASKFEYTVLRTVTFQNGKGLIISDNFKRVETTIYMSQDNIHILNSHFTFRLKVLKRTINENLIMLRCIDVDTDKTLDFTMNIPQKEDKKTMSFLLDGDGDGFCFEAFFK